MPLETRTDHRRKSYIYDTETGERLCIYAVGDGTLAFTWCDASANDTARPVTIEEAQMWGTPPGWRLDATEPRCPRLVQGTSADDHRANLF